MEKKRIGLMVDLETWGTRNDAVIRQIAILPFHWDTLEAEEPLIFYPDEIQQFDAGRTSDLSTVRFWEVDNAEMNNKLVELQLENHQGCRTISRDVLRYLSTLKKKYSVSFIARGATTFDYPILNNFIEMFTGDSLKIAFYRIYDLRSLTSILKIITNYDFTVNISDKHDALCDCYEQLQQLRRVKNSVTTFLETCEKPSL